MSTIAETTISINDVEIESNHISDNDPLFFSLEINNDENKALCSFSLDSHGFYYINKKKRKRSMKKHPFLSGYISMEKMKQIFESLLEVGLINHEDDQDCVVAVKDNKVVISNEHYKSETHEKIANSSAIEKEKLISENFEVWLSQMQYEPYCHDKFLQNIKWVGELTKAIKKVANVVGEGNELEFKYWSDLSAWEFILNSISIAKQFGFTFDHTASWKNIISALKLWVDSMPNHPETNKLVLSGSSFFYDMVQFFVEKRTLVDPLSITENVLKND